MTAEAADTGEESEEEYELLPLARGRLRGLYESTINGLCRLPESRIEMNCLSAIRLRSSVPPDKAGKRERKEESDGCEGELPIRPRPCGKSLTHPEK